jgi:hypothetical protein
MKRQPWFWPIKLFLKRISGKELWLRPEVKYDVLQSDSWKYIPSLLNEQSIVYSLGVGDLIDFDLDLISQVDMLKIDVEGAEYLILDGLREGDSLPKQLLVEYHHRFPGIGKQRTAESISKLRQLGYRIFAISETGREVCFVLDKD